MRQRFARLMAGRYGVDQLNRFMLIVALVFMLLGAIFKGTFGKVCDVVMCLMLVLSYFRMFSRNIYKRQEENGKFIRVFYKVSGKARIYRERWIQRKDYKFFSCPSCKTTLRVPRGHGKISIVCRKCGTSFSGKT